ncbi:MAG: MoaD/ThiS family protein [Acidobacteriota bacterium]
MNEPISVEIFLPSLLHATVGGRSAVTVEAATFQSCLDALVATYPLVGPHLFDDGGTLREHVNIFFNDQNSRWLDDWNQSVRAGDTITILQAVSGG